MNRKTCHANKVVTLHTLFGRKRNKLIRQIPFLHLFQLNAQIKTGLTKKMDILYYKATSPMFLEAVRKSHTINLLLLSLSVKNYSS